MEHLPKLFVLCFFIINQSDFHFTTLFRSDFYAFPISPTLIFKNIVEENNR